MLIMPDSLEYLPEKEKTLRHYFSILLDHIIQICSGITSGRVLDGVLIDQVSIQKPYQINAYSWKTVEYHVASR